MRLRDGLDQTPVASLRRMAELHGLSVDDTATRAELIERLGAGLADPDVLRPRLAAHFLDHGLGRLAHSADGERAEQEDEHGA